MAFKEEGNILRKSAEDAKVAHKVSGPYKSAADAINSPTFGAMHRARKDLTKFSRARSKALKKKLN